VPRLVQAAAAGESVSSTTLTATFPSPTVAGHLLVLASSVYSGATNQISRVTDPAGNAWTRIGAFCTAGHYSDGEIWYAANAGSVTSVTVTMATATVVAMQVQEFSGVAATNPLDVSRGASNTGTAADSGSLNPAQPGELAVGFLAGHGSVQAMTISAAGYTAQPQQTSSNGASTPVSVVIGYRVHRSVTQRLHLGRHLESEILQPVEDAWADAGGGEPTDDSSLAVQTAADEPEDVLHRDHVFFHPGDLADLHDFPGSVPQPLEVDDDVDCARDLRPNRSRRQVEARHQDQSLDSR